MFDLHTDKSELDREYIAAMHDVHKWLFYFSFRYGVQREHVKKYMPEYFNPARQETEELTYRWSYYNAVISVYIDWKPPESNGYVNWEYLDGRQFAEWRPYQRGHADTYPIDHVYRLARGADELIHTLLPNIKQETSICPCQSGIHQVYSRQRMSHACICKQIGDRWLCENCASRLVLFAPEATEPLNNAQVKERAKMTVSLRFTVLERDAFQCKACGRSPRSDDTVKLHVDHILPIAKGGKTELSNLHTLCQDCNLGKSDKRVEQMEMWNESA